MALASSSMRLSRWLDSFGFKAPPFAQQEADQEHDFLPKCFVDRPYLQSILGDPAHPQTAILTANRGEGKSATREMLMYECLYGGLRGRALPVRYDHFETIQAILTSDSPQLTLANHVRAIARVLFRTIKEEVPPTYFDRLDPFDACLLLSLALALADTVSAAWLRRLLPAATPIDGVLDSLDPAETLLTLAGLVCELGPSQQEHYQSVYILVDRLDEITPGSPEIGVRAIQPLAGESALLNREKLAFKFFLPLDFVELVRPILPISPDKTVFERIDWDQKSLPRVINQRINYFSDGRQEHYDQLFASDLRRAKTIEQLMEKAENMPRALIRLFHYMMLSHLAREDTIATNMLDRTDLNEAILRFDREAGFPRRRAASLAASVPTAQPGQETPAVRKGLFIDDSDFVWVDGRQLPTALSPQEFALLKVLYRRTPNLVSNENLIYTVWPEGRDSSESGRGGTYDEQNLRKLVDRVRDKLENGASGKKDRFIKNVRGRGYWLSAE